jgi:hypothetical protein
MSTHRHSALADLTLRGDQQDLRTSEFGEFAQLGTESETVADVKRAAEHQQGGRSSGLRRTDSSPHRPEGSIVLPRDEEASFL